jgi:hypothetical protein
MGALLIAANKAAYLTGRCRIYEVLYLRRSDDNTSDNYNSTDNFAATPAQRGLKGALTDLYKAILQLLANAIHLYGKSSASRALRAVIDPTKVTDLVDECTALETRVDIKASNCQRDLSTTRHAVLLKLLETYQKPIARTDERVAKLWLRADTDYRHQVMCWASSIPYEKVHDTARAGRTPNTGQWLLAHACFREWRDCSASTILWLHEMRKFTGSLSPLTIHSYFMCRFLFPPTMPRWAGEGLTKAVPPIKLVLARRSWHLWSSTICSRHS